MKSMPYPIIIEQPKGSYKSFEIENDVIWKDYPLKGVTYPVEYGYIKGYASEDNHDLDVFVGSGKKTGYITIWRCDVPLETKMILNVTKKEFTSIISAFRPVIKEQRIFKNKKEFENFIAKYKR